MSCNVTDVNYASDRWKYKDITWSREFPIPSKETEKQYGENWFSNAYFTTAPAKAVANLV